jgi:hypothetical protein
MSKNQGFKKFVNMLAFIGIVAIAVVLLLRMVLGDIIKVDSDVINAISLIAECIAYAVTAVYAFYFVYSKHSPAYMITYVIAVILIIVLLVV